MKSLSRLRHWYPRIAVLALLGAVFGVYSPGLNGPFMFDDYINIVNNDDVAMSSPGPENLARAARSGVSSRLGRPLSYVSFGLNHYQAGGFDDSFPFKLTNVVIHAINTLLVFWLLRLIFDQFARRQGRGSAKHEWWLPFMAAAIWALHPVHLTSVLYVVQRMTSLSALFVLAGLIAYVSGRQQLLSQPKRGTILMSAGIVGGTGLGLLAKENAILLLPFALVIEFTLFAGHGLRRRVMPSRPVLYATAAGACIVILGLWLGGHLDWIADSYRTRNFTLSERLLTESRVLWFYLGLLFFPSISRHTLFHDDFTVSTGLFAPLTTLPAVIGLAGVLAAGFALRRKHPVPAFAILWFLAGHSLESSFIALELVHEHRNYLPSLGPLAAAVYGLAILARRQKRFTLLALLAVSTIFAFTTFVLATNWRDGDSLARFMLRHHPGSARSHEAMASLYLLKHKDPILAMEHYRSAAELAPHEVSYLVKLVLTAAETDPARTRRDFSASQDARPGIWALLRVAQRDRRSVYMLDKEIHDQLARRLAVAPIRAGAYVAFDELATCLLQRPQVCGHLRDPAIGWLGTVIDNPNAPTKVRLQLMQLLVRLYMGFGQLADAQTLSERALGISPMDPALVLMHANALYRNGRLGDAEQGLRFFEADARPGYEHEWEQAGHLLELVRRRRSK